jgi:hypothetical protein
VLKFTTCFTGAKAQILTHCARQERAAMLELRDKTLKAQLEKVEGELFECTRDFACLLYWYKRTKTDVTFFPDRDF